MSKKKDIVTDKEQLERLVRCEAKIDALLAENEDLKCNKCNQYDTLIKTLPALVDSLSGYRKAMSKDYTSEDMEKSTILLINAIIDLIKRIDLPS